MDSSDWALLSSLFAGDSKHRHKMGLRRGSAEEFYAATAAGDEIRREKQAVLEREGMRHSLVTLAGHEAAQEFASVIGLTLDAAADGQACNRELSLALEPDLLIVAPPDWTLVWASVCFPSRWSLEGKAGKPLAWIHDTVPGLNPELGEKINAFFARLVPGEGWRRANWGLAASAARNQHPAESIPPLHASTKHEDVFVRIEDQHLLKLPKSGAIAFGIRIVSLPWLEIIAHPTIGLSLMNQLRSMPKGVADYKGLGEFITSNA